MEFLRFYGRVFREAFRHSLDIAQSVIFVLLVVTGLVVARNPGLKPMIDALDLSGAWVAIIVMGSIISIRLILAPYWLWKAADAGTRGVPPISR